MDPNNSETQDIVDTVATENTDIDSQEHDEGQEQQPEQEPQTQEQEEAQKAEQKKGRAQERIEKLARENAELKRWRAEQEAKAQQPQTTSERPKIEDFDDYSAYQTALEDYQITQAEKRVFDKLNQEKQSKAQVEAQTRIDSAMSELAEQGVDLNAYEAKLKDLPPLPIQLNQFGLAEKDALVLLTNLIDDTDTYLDIASMSPVQAAMKIGQIIGQKQTKPQAQRQSKAPPPINPVKANAPATRSPEKMSDAEWYQAEKLKRNKGK